MFPTVIGTHQYKGFEIALPFPPRIIASLGTDPRGSELAQNPIDTALEFAESIKFFKQPVLEVLEVQRQLPLTNTVTTAVCLIALPAPDAIALNRKKLLNEGWLRGAILFGMHADRKFLLLDLRGFDIGFEVDAALILIMPVGLVQLEIGPTIVDLPISPKPTRLPQLLFKIAENTFHVFHETAPC